ncbi:hypothetical protein D3C80_2219160 [compost metagenome]
MFGQVDHLLQLALAEGALTMQPMGDFCGEEGAGYLPIRGYGPLLAIFGEGAFDQGAGQL